MTPAPRYSGVAVALHWLSALGVFAALGVGLTMKNAHLAPLRMFQLFQLHKSIGVTVLLLVALRLVWRALRRPPPLPETLAPWAQRAAQAGHGLLYLLLIAVPLTGWIVVSASPLNIPTVLYGAIPWPHLPWFSALEDKKAFEPLLKTAHDTLAFAFIAVILGHVAAALRHAITGDVPLARMGVSFWSKKS
jgi:cytochrome b561